MHIPHYLVLLAIFITVLLSRMFFASETNLLILVLYLIILIYVGWGIIHHLAEHDLTPKIVVEYILIGMIAMLASAIILKGGL